jgi:hypothetical protein
MHKVIMTIVAPVDLKIQYNIPKAHYFVANASHTAASKN